MTILGKRTIPWSSLGYIPNKMPRVYRIQPRTTTRLRRNARYLGNKKRKKRRLKNKVKRYLNKKKFKDIKGGKKQ